MQIMDETGNDTVKEESRCFVCDVAIQGRFYSLATCRTQNSRSRVIEKLGELVGERYMVVISEDDVICRNCARLINTLDKLETEMRSIRNDVLRFLEQKYSLTDGELRGSDDKPKPCQPPQITKSNTKEIVDYCDKQNDIDLETEWKKDSTYPRDSKIQKKSHPWLQCDKCKYTTHFNSFTMNHLRDHVKQRAFCDKCGISENRQDTRHSCIRTDKLENKENERDNSDTMARNDSMNTLLLEKTLQPTLSHIQTTPPPLIGSSSCDHLYISNIPLANDPTSTKQSMSILQPTNMIDIDVSKNTSSELRPIQKMEIRNERRKQVLTLKDDGTVNLVEVPYWKET